MFGLSVVDGRKTEGKGHRDPRRERKRKAVRGKTSCDENRERMGVMQTFEQGP